MRLLVVPLCIDFEKVGPNVEMTIWAHSALRQFKTKVNGATVLFESNGKERYLCGGMARGFTANLEGSPHFQQADLSLYPEACLIGALRLPPEETSPC